MNDLGVYDMADDRSWANSAALPQAQAAGAPPNARAAHSAWWERALRRLCAVLLTVLVGALCFRAYTESNDFPIEYHPDEPSKVRQVLGEDSWNFNHPPLLLEVTSWVVEKWNVERTPQKVAEAGRGVSAFFAAAAVAALALSGYLCAGFWGLLIVGTATGLCAFHYVHAHYMKEDAALVFGLALVVLTTRLLWSWKSMAGQATAAMLSALAAALAMSGKYVGVASLGLALPAVLLAPPLRWGQGPLVRLLVFVPWLVLAVVAINHKAILNYEDFQAGLGREVEHAQSDHLGLTMPRPNDYFLGVIRRATPPGVQILAAAFAAFVLLTAWRRPSSATRNPAARCRGSELMAKPNRMSWSNGMPIIMPNVNRSRRIWTNSFATIAASRLGEKRSAKRLIRLPPALARSDG